MGLSPKPKVAIGVSVAGMLLIAVAAIAFEILSGPGSKGRQVKVDPAAVAAASASAMPGRAPAVPAKPESEWMPQFKAVYALADGETLKRVPKPWIPQRIEFYRADMGAGQVQAIPQGPDFYALNYDAAAAATKPFSMITAWFGQPDVRGMLTAVMQIDDTLLVGPADVLNKRPGGDIVVRKGATDEQRAAGLAQMLRRDFNRAFTLAQKDMDREVIVVSGTFAYTGPTTASAAATRPAQPAPRRPQRTAGPMILVYRGAPRGNGWNTRGSAEFLRYMQNVFQTPLIADGKLGGEREPWEMDSTGYLGRRRDTGVDAAQVDEVLANVAAQTKLHFRREHRTIKTWVLSEGESATTTTTQASGLLHP